MRRTKRPEDRVAAHVSAIAERHLVKYECLNIGSVGNEADHARREARFNVAFQSSAKLSKTRGCESSVFSAGAVVVLAAAVWRVREP